MEYLAKINETTIENIDPRHVPAPVFLTDTKGAVAIQRKHLDGFIFRVYNPVFPNPGPLI